MIKDPADLVAEFHTAFNIPEARDELTVELRRKLIVEEALEAQDALDEIIFVPSVNNLEMAAKELADLVYVVYGTALVLGIDLNEALRRVHASNMSKIPESGAPLLRGDGKILKPDTYREPNMRGVVK